MMSCYNVTTTTKDWIIDSGASDHMTPLLSNLTSPRASTSPTHINLLTGATAQITHTGTIFLSNGLTLSHVLCVPYFKHNLLSVQKLIQHNHCEVMFLPSHCIILDCHTQKVKAVGVAKQGLYYLVHTHDPLAWLSKHTSSINSSHHINTASSKTTISTWHHRLGHAPLAKLHLIPDIPKSSNTEICITCPMAKFHNLPFNISDSHAPHTFALIHIDIWGPYKVCTKDKCRFFLTILDDHSRHTWVSLLSHKSDSLEVIEAFYAYAQTQFGKSIQVIRSDNAMEFSDSKCIQFFATTGIIHQTSCSHRPEQNARTKCQG